MDPSLSAQVLVGAESVAQALEQRAAADWLRVTYAKHLYGGWWHEDGRFIEKPARHTIEFHEANKALFCPFCLICGKPERAEQGLSCTCEGGARFCWRHIGQAPKDEDAVFSCKEHGETPWRRALFYGTVLNAAGNQSGKTHGAASEFSAWILGRRPWDDTLTAPKRPGGLWLINVKDLQGDIPSIIQPELELRLASLNPYLVKNSNKAPAALELRETGEIIRFSSNVQVRNAGQAGTLGLEGPRFRGVWEDEPMERRSRDAILRGLIKERNVGWGREVISATILRSAYLFLNVYQQAANKGGELMDVYAMDSSVYDNPIYTPARVNQIVSQWTPEEREARIHGRALHLEGRVFSMWEDAVHVMDDDTFDPLLLGGSQEVLRSDAVEADASDWPIFCSVDPHTRRPWAIIWAAITPEDDILVVDCWPKEAYEKLKRSGKTLDQYADVIRAVERRFPGGSRRVKWREMDPNYGNTNALGGALTVQNEMQQRGLFFRCDGNNNIDEGHEAVREVLRFDKDKPLGTMNRPRLRVAASCRNVWWSFNNYVWKPWDDDTRTPADKPMDTGKDFMDCVRYMVMRKPRYRSWKSPDGSIQERRREYRERRKLARVRRSTAW